MRLRIQYSSSDEKLERARGLGADELIKYCEIPDCGARVLELADGDGVDVTIETEINDPGSHQTRSVFPASLLPGEFFLIITVPQKTYSAET